METGVRGVNMVIVRRNVLVVFKKGIDTAIVLHRQQLGSLVMDLLDMYVYVTRMRVLVSVFFLGVKPENMHKKKSIKTISLTQDSHMRRRI